MFGDIFFPPGTDRLTGVAAAFATYAVGFFARPLGGIVFGHVGDKMGRRTALVVTLTLMGAGTFLIGMLPLTRRSGSGRRYCWYCSASSRALPSAANGAARS